MSTVSSGPEPRDAAGPWRVRVESPSLPDRGRLEASLTPSQWSVAWKTFRRNRLAVAGLVVIVLSIAAAALAR